jgi:hypothetical protein
MGRCAEVHRSPTEGSILRCEAGMSNGVKSFFSDLRKKRIIETLAAFIAGGWLFLEFVDRILIAHWELEKNWLGEVSHKDADPGHPEGVPL